MPHLTLDGESALLRLRGTINVLRELTARRSMQRETVELDTEDFVFLLMLMLEQIDQAMPDAA
jgi:hypothetical protein